MHQRSKGHSPVPGCWGNRVGSPPALWQSRPHSTGTLGSARPRLRGNGKGQGSPSPSLWAAGPGWRDGANSQQLWGEKLGIPATLTPPHPGVCTAMAALEGPGHPRLADPGPSSPSGTSHELGHRQSLQLPGSGRHIWAAEEVGRAHRQGTAGPAPPCPRGSGAVPLLLLKKHHGQLGARTYTLQAALHAAVVDLLAEPGVAGLVPVAL